MKKFSVTLTSLLLFHCLVSGQIPKLKSARHGLDLINKNGITKEAIIDDTKFAVETNKQIDILRFDNVGTTMGGDGPLIISSEEPIRTDSLGLTPLKLVQDSLSSLINLIVELDTKIYKRQPSDYLFRVTYRSNGRINQYYIANAKETTKFFKSIESRIIKMNNKEALLKFYHFLWPSSLLKRTNGILTYSPSGKPEWKY